MSAAVDRAIESWIGALAGVAAVRPDQHLTRELRLDSFQLMELVARIDQTYGVDLNVSLEEGVRVETVGDLCDAVRRARGGSGAQVEPPMPVAHPAYFEHAGQRLFWVLHAAPQEGARRVAVLCHPFGHEYLQTQRALSHLAARLAARGLPCARFELPGHGDSAGDLWSARVESWLDSMGAAARRALAETGAESVVLVGARLGATLAASAAPALPECRELVLWNPILEPARYVRELERLDRRTFRTRADRRGRDGELLGFRVHPDLRAGIAGLDLESGLGSTSARILHVDNEQDRASARFAQRLRESGRGETLVLPEAWDWRTFFSAIYWPAATIEEILRHVAPAEQ